MLISRFLQFIINSTGLLIVLLLISNGIHQKGSDNKEVLGSADAKECIKINIKHRLAENWAVAAVLWLVYVQVSILSQWKMLSETYRIYQKADAYIAAVAIMWVATLFIGIVAPFFAGFRGLKWFVASAVMEALSCILVLSLL